MFNVKLPTSLLVIPTGGKVDIEQFERAHRKTGQVYILACSCSGYMELSDHIQNTSTNRGFVSGIDYIIQQAPNLISELNEY